MTSTEAAIRRCLATRRPAVLPFLCGGYPAPGVTERSLIALSELGCPVIEIGIPFSDPIADGPTIAAAMHAALNPADPAIPPATPDAVFREVSNAKSRTSAAIVAMVSYSIVAKRGEAAFIKDAAAAGFDGFIVPDLPLEESEPFRRLAAEAQCSVSLLIAPTTPPDRAATIARACTGFVYLLARTGITGTSAATQSPTDSRSDLAPRIAALRQVTPLPIACGFGITSRLDVQSVLATADAAIVGSALVTAMTHAADPVTAAMRFVTDLMQ